MKEEEKNNGDGIHIMQASSPLPLSPENPQPDTPASSPRSNVFTF
jgi:hypothetical protein